MKPRARRVTIAAAVLGVAVIGALMVAPGPVRDHVEAWRFQLTRETETFQPLAPTDQGNVLYGPATDLQILATYSNLNVIYDPVERKDRTLWSIGRDSTLRVSGVHNSTYESRGSEYRSRWFGYSFPISASKEQNVVSFLRSIKEKGYRILEQRFPRRAYVVIRDEDATP